MFKIIIKKRQFVIVQQEWPSLKTILRVIDCKIQIENIIEIVNIITNDGKVIVGVLKGYDSNLNLLLSDSHERVFSTDEGVSITQIGLYIIRGDSIAIIGMIDEELDSTIDYENLKAEPLSPVVH